jgi:hypothetical protein
LPAGTVDGTVWSMQRKLAEFHLAHKEIGCSVAAYI